MFKYFINVKTCAWNPVYNNNWYRGIITSHTLFEQKQRIKRHLECYICLSDPADGVDEMDEVSGWLNAKCIIIVAKSSWCIACNTILIICNVTTLTLGEWPEIWESKVKDVIVLKVMHGSHRFLLSALFHWR